MKRLHIENKNFEVKAKLPKKTWITLLICLGVLFLIFFITNPRYIPFLSDEQTQNWEKKLAQSEFFGDLNDSTDISNFSFVMIPQLLTMILIVLAALMAVRIILHTIRPKTKRFATVKTLVASSVKYIAGLIAILWGLHIIGVPIGTIFASLGITALILGFSAETIIADMISGLLMVFESQYNIGDVVEVNGFLGTVTDIALRTTSITDFGGNVKIMNNSEVRNILNRSNMDSVAICDVKISYEESLEKAEKVLDEILCDVRQRMPEVFIEKPEYLGVQDLSEYAIVMRIFAKTTEDTVFSARRTLNREILLGFEKNGIKIPCQQIVVKENQR